MYKTSHFLVNRSHTGLQLTLNCPLQISLFVEDKILVTKYECMFFVFKTLKREVLLIISYLFFKYIKI